ALCCIIAPDKSTLYIHSNSHKSDVCRSATDVQRTAHTVSRAQQNAHLARPYVTQSREYIFFFSSSRRHTRFSHDWSSDVCSSDLMVSQGTITPRSITSTLLHCSTTLTMFLPISCTSPFTVAIRMRPLASVLEPLVASMK